MSAKAAAISAIYGQVGAPDWAAPNLDGLADVLRDLSWLPDGRASITLPDLDALTDDGRGALLLVLWRAVRESAGSPHPVQITITPD